MRSERRVRTCTLSKPGQENRTLALADHQEPSGRILARHSSAPSLANRRIPHGRGLVNRFGSPHAWHYDVVASGIVTDMTARSRAGRPGSRKPDPVGDAQTPTDYTALQTGRAKP